jgi:hypothetical protein
MKHGDQRTMIFNSVYRQIIIVATLSDFQIMRRLNFLHFGKSKNSVNRGSDKSEVYEIIREKPNDEESRILELRKFDGEGKLDFTMEYHNWS